MVSVYLCKTSNKDPHKEYALMIREYSGIDIEWTTLCFMDAYAADRLQGENITYWDGEPECKEEVRSLRLANSGLREAWDTYQVLKKLATPNK